MVKLALSLLLLAVAGATTPAVQRLNAVQLRYDPAEWAIEEAALGRYRVLHTDRYGERRHVMDIRLDYGGPCSVEAMAALAETRVGFEGRSGVTALPNGLSIHWAAGDLGCRNWAPRPLAACVRHMSVAHLFESAPMGCRGPGADEDELLALLRGLEPR